MQPQLAQEDQLKPGDILVFTNAQGENLVTTWVTRSPYYHAGLYAGAKKVLEMRTPGVMTRDLSGEEGGHYFVVIPAPQGQGEAALAWSQANVKDKYDDVGVAVLILNRIFFHLHLNYTPRDAYTCGEFVAAAYARAGVQLFPDMPLSDVEPADFARYVPTGTPTQTFYHNKPKRRSFKLVVAGLVAMGVLALGIVKRRRG